MRLSLYDWFVDLTFTLSITLLVIVSSVSGMIFNQQTKLNNSLTVIDAPVVNKPILNLTTNPSNDFDLRLAHKLYSLKSNLDLIEHSETISNFIAQGLVSKKPAQHSSFHNLIISSACDDYKPSSSLLIPTLPVANYSLKNHILSESLDLTYFVANANNINTNLGSSPSTLLFNTLNLPNNLDLAKQSR